MAWRPAEVSPAPTSPSSFFTGSESPYRIGRAKGQLSRKFDECLVGLKPFSKTIQGSRIPDKYRQEMPTSARKVQPPEEPPSSRHSPIVQSSFYGLPKEKSSSSLAGLVRPLRVLRDDSKSDKKSKLKKDGNRAKSRKAANKGPALSLGFNRGVSHAIRKPKLKASQNCLKKASLIGGKGEKSLKQLFKESLKEVDEMRRRKSKKSSGPLNFLPDNVKKGSLSLTTSSPGGSSTRANKISFEIKDGQPVFRLRRSPRKNLVPVPASKVPEAAAKPSKSNKLFTPSGSRDYMGAASSSSSSFSPEKSVRRSRLPLPSPVKFCPNDDEDDEEEAGGENDVSQIIDQLEDPADQGGGEDLPEGGHGRYSAMVVTEDELDRISREAVEQITALQLQEDGHHQQVDAIGFQLAWSGDHQVEDGVTQTEASTFEQEGHDRQVLPSQGGDQGQSPDKVIRPSRSSPRKRLRLEEPKAPETSSQPACSSDLGPDGVGKAIRGILASIPPATEEEKAHQRDFKSGRPSNRTDTTMKVFPIFDKENKASKMSNGHPDLVHSPDKSNRVSTRRSLQTRMVVTAQPDKDGLKQMVIDAGQREIGAKHCPTCDFYYTVGDANEEKAHDVRHAQVASGLMRFSGWKSEDVKAEFHDGRIIAVGPGHPKKHWNKVEEVLEVVDSSLGVAPGLSKRSSWRHEEVKAYLFVANSRVVGFLLAEVLGSAGVKVSVSKEGQDGVRVVEDLPRGGSSPLKGANGQRPRVGISRIWVAPDWQRRGVATRLADAMRSNFLLSAGVIVSPHLVAFSHTTPQGTAFATRYVSSLSFFTYAPKTSSNSS